MSRRSKKTYPYFGTYWAFYLDADGRRQRPSLKTRDHVIAAKRFTQLLEHVDKGVLGFSRVPQKLSLTEVAEQFPERGMRELAETTAQCYSECLRLHVLPYFKRASLRSVSPKKILAFIRKRQDEGAAPNTIHKDLAALSAVFNFALAEELIHYNPVKAIRKPN